MQWLIETYTLIQHVTAILCHWAQYTVRIKCQSGRKGCRIFGRKRKMRRWEGCMGWQLRALARTFSSFYSWQRRRWRELSPMKHIKQTKNGGNWSFSAVLKVSVAIPSISNIYAIYASPYICLYIIHTCKYSFLHPVACECGYLQCLSSLYMLYVHAILDRVLFTYYLLSNALVHVESLKFEFKVTCLHTYTHPHTCSQ